MSLKVVVKGGRRMSLPEEQPKAKKIMPPRAGSPQERARQTHEQHPSITATDWREQAECAEAEDITIFMPHELPVRQQKSAIKEAKLYCSRCAVREECLAEALAETTQTVLGIWGGLTQQERTNLQLKVVDQA